MSYVMVNVDCAGGSKEVKIEPIVGAFGILHFPARKNPNPK